MSEPITLTERERGIIAAIAYKLMCYGRIEAESVGGAIIDWLANQPTESAPPPRVPVSSAHPGREGVESGPGQPMDMCDLLKVAEGWGDPSAPAATLAREAAAEIRRLREQVKTERRAGIEAAAQVAANIEVIAIANTPVHASRLILDAIRALAYKPAPDAARKGG